MKKVVFVVIAISLLFGNSTAFTSSASDYQKADKELYTLDQQWNSSPTMINELNEPKVCLATNPEQGNLRAANKKETTNFAELARQSEEFHRFSEDLTTDHTDFWLDEYPEVTIVGEDVNVSFAIKGGAGYSFFALVFDHKSTEILYTVSGLYSFVGGNILGAL